MNKSSLVSNLKHTVDQLDDLITKLEEEAIIVSFFYDRGEINRSSRLKLATIIEYNVHYDAKNIESNNDKRT